jgi:hypothetical protein
MDTINTRLKVKTDTTANWALVSGTFTPLKGEIIVYSDYQTVGEGNEQTVIPGIKIGTGNAYVGDLPFVDQDTRATLLAHISNSGIHVTGRQKAFWSNKIDIDESSGQEVRNETLIFTRDDWRV